MSQTPTASTVRRVLPESTSTERGYVAAWNMQVEEFPIEAIVQSTQSPALPIITVMPANGLQPMNVPTVAAVNWNWIRVAIEKPADIQSPLVIETLMLSTSELEPPVATSSQYIRVVIRNFTIPEGENPTKKA